MEGLEERCENCGSTCADYYDQLDAILCGKCAHHRQHPEQYWDGYPDVLPKGYQQGGEMNKDMQELMSRVTEVTGFYCRYISNGMSKEDLSGYLQTAVEMEKIAQLRAISQHLEEISKEIAVAVAMRGGER